MNTTNLFLELSQLVFFCQAHEVFCDLLGLQGVGVQVFDHGLSGGGAGLGHDAQRGVGILTLRPGQTSTKLKKV